MHFRTVSILAFSLFAVLVAAQGMVANSPEEAKPLKVGAKAPDAHLQTLDGKATTLKSLIGGKPTVVVFYRGNWCPFCNRHLADLGTVDGELRSLGYQILAISPDLPSEEQKTSDNHKLPYRLISDPKAESLKAFGVAYRMDDGTFTTYRDKYNVDLERSSGEKHHILPVPSVFIVDTKGVIRYVHSNPDYKVRLKGSEVVAAARSLKS